MEQKKPILFYFGLPLNPLILNIAYQVTLLHSLRKVVDAWLTIAAFVGSTVLDKYVMSKGFISFVLCLRLKPRNTPTHVKKMENKKEV